MHRVVIDGKMNELISLPNMLMRNASHMSGVRKTAVANVANPSNLRYPKFALRNAVSSAVRSRKGIHKTSIIIIALS